MSNSPLPRLYVLGDSISMHYGPDLANLCEGTLCYDRKRDGAAAVGASLNLDVPTGENAGDSTMILNYLRYRRTINPIPADILLLNCGLHDIKRSEESGDAQVPIATYEKNLRAIVEESKLMNLSPIWVNTTPVIDDRHNTGFVDFFRFERDVEAYNHAAEKIMLTEAISLIDLHRFSQTLLPSGLADHVHYTEPARRRQAEFIFSELQRILEFPRSH